MPTDTNTNTTEATAVTPAAVSPAPPEIQTNQTTPPPVPQPTPSPQPEIVGADEPVEEKKGLIDQINEAKADSETMQDESAELAAENGIELAPELTKGERLLAALGYISWLCILPLVIKPHSEYCQIHGRQGLIITLAYFFIGWMGMLNWWINFIMGVIYIVFMIWGIIKSTQGLGKEHLPLVGKVADKLDWNK